MTLIARRHHYSLGVAKELDNKNENKNLSIFHDFISIIFPVKSLADHCLCKDLKIAIDIGHSTFDPGATSARGRPEFDFNLAMGTMLWKHLLAHGYPRSFMIVNPLHLLARAQIAEKEQADLFISIHHDSVQPYYLHKWKFNDKIQHYSDAFRGYSLLASTKNLQFSSSLALAQQIGKQFRQAGLIPAYHHSKKVAGGHHNLLDEELGVYQFDNLVVLKETTMPALLIEFGVIVHREEEIFLEQEETRKKMIQAILAGVNQFHELNCSK